MLGHLRYEKESLESIKGYLVQNHVFASGQIGKLQNPHVMEQSTKKSFGSILENDYS